MVLPEHWGLAIWLSRSLVWALAENLWGDMRNVHRSRPTNVTDLELFNKEEWANLAMLRCPTQTDSYLKRLSALTKSKVKLISNLVVIKINCFVGGFLQLGHDCGLILNVWWLNIFTCGWRVLVKVYWTECGGYRFCSLLKVPWLWG